MTSYEGEKRGKEDPNRHTKAIRNARNSMKTKNRSHF